MKKTTSERDPQAVAHLRELVTDIGVAMITTVTPDGALRSRPMVTREMRDEGELWFFTSEESGKAHDLAEEHAVNVSYADPARQRYISITGSANLVRDPERASELWDESLAAYFPRGLEDESLALLCVHVESAEFWDASARAMVDVAGFTRPGLSGPRKGEHTQVAIRNTTASG